MTRSLTVDWTLGLPALEASTIPLGYRGGGSHCNCDTIRLCKRCVVSSLCYNETMENANKLSWSCKTKTIICTFSFYFIVSVVHKYEAVVLSYYVTDLRTPIGHLLGYPLCLVVLLCYLVLWAIPESVRHRTELRAESIHDAAGRFLQTVYGNHWIHLL